jgi:NADPH:quinone reductase-like Zn-dependent oxidoreductase
MPERVLALAGGPVDVVLDTAPVSNALPGLIRTVAAPDHVLTLSDFAAAAGLGVRTAFGDPDDAAAALRTDILGDYAQLAAQGRFSIPIAGTFPLEDWRTAAEASLSGHAHGKLVLRIA